MEITLKVGDKAVYPGHGVGQITSIEEKNIMGNNLTFYSIKIIESGTKIMIPKNRMHSIGVRPVISKTEAQKVINILSEKTSNYVKPVKNWQKRHQSYMSKIKTGSIYEIAEVIRDLNNIKADKELSYGEKQMMDKAKNMVLSELSLAVDKKDLTFFNNDLSL